jgi:hypothetical protein
VFIRAGTSDGCLPSDFDFVWCFCFVFVCMFMLLVFVFILSKVCLWVFRYYWSVLGLVLPESAFSSLGFVLKCRE